LGEYKDLRGDRVAVGDPDSHVRRLAVEGIAAEYGLTKLTELMTVALSDETWSVRLASVKAIPTYKYDP
jgi:TRAP-type uncharacterized transport system substrate-binding protein